MLVRNQLGDARALRYFVRFGFAFADAVDVFRSIAARISALNASESTVWPRNINRTARVAVKARVEYLARISDRRAF